MVARVSRAIFTAAAVDEEGGQPAIVAQTYCIETTAGLYVGGLIVKTGLTSQIPPADYSQFPLLSVKSAIRNGILFPIHVLVTASSGTGTGRYMIYINDSDAVSAGGLIGETWPIGKLAGGSITSIIYPTRVKSRV
jgi:hypothetical protein